MNYITNYGISGLKLNLEVLNLKIYHKS